MSEDHQAVRRPNLFIIGAAKCGTTSLHAYLGRHPDAFMSEPKEPGYFVPEMDYYPKDLGWYLDLFAGAGDARIVGESSTHYTKVPVFSCVADRVADFSPEARVIYLMRDPVERAVSHYWHNVRKHQETRPMLQAIRDDVQYRAFGHYALQLRPWMSRFDSGSILTLVFEEMVADPRATLDEVVRWLGLPKAPGDATLGRKNARPDEVTRVRGRGHLHEFRSTGVWETLSPMVPKPLKTWATGLTLAKVRPTEEPDDGVVAHLRPWARESVSALEELLGREFPMWTTSLGDGS